MPAEIIHECSHLTSGFRPRVYADRRNNLWAAWIEVVPEAGGAPKRTGEETSQPSRKDVVYWAEGLEPVFLEGALARAR